MKQDAQCYMCGVKATSREHVPPLCLFPGNKDYPFDNFRRNLITVPSCDEHNSNKSKDDEFLFASMAGAVGNNYLAFIINRTKVSRIFARRGEHFINVISREPKHTSIKIEGMEFPVTIGFPDAARLTKCFEHIARGLYYHEYGKVFEGECIVLFGFINHNQENYRKFIEGFERRFECLKDKVLIKGDNPSVFQYAMLEPDMNGIIDLRITIYEGSNIYVAFKTPEAIKSLEFIQTIMGAANKISIEYPDGKPPIVLDNIHEEDNKF